MSNTEAVFISKVIESNRITLPKHVVEFLGVKKGDFLEIKARKIDPSGQVVPRRGEEGPKMTGQEEGKVRL